jgi:uncharacterized OsmC-like protein
VDVNELRQKQAPLKARYRDDPGSAITPLRARASLDGPGVSVQVGTWAGPVRAGLHLATGGDGADACSGDMLMEALVACAAVTLRSVALAMHVEIRNGSLQASGTFDASGTLGVARDVPVGCSNIAVHAALDTDADADQLERLAQLTERYCVVSQSLRTPVRFTIERVIRAGPAGG